MSIKNFGGIVHIGTYNDHHKEATFHVPAGTNPADLIRAFMSDRAEDIPSSSMILNVQRKKATAFSISFLTITSARVSSTAAKTILSSKRLFVSASNGAISAISNPNIVLLPYSVSSPTPVHSKPTVLQTVQSQMHSV